MANRYGRYAASNTPGTTVRVNRRLVKSWRSPEPPNPPGPPSLRGKGGDVPPAWPDPVEADKSGRDAAEFDHPSPSGGGAGGGVDPVGLSWGCALPACVRT